eukprot:Awhi_evm1s6667
MLNFSAKHSPVQHVIDCPHLTCNVVTNRDMCATFAISKNANAFNWHKKRRDCCVKQCDGTNLKTVKNPDNRWE